MALSRIHEDVIEFHELIRKLRIENERLKAALKLCQDYADKVMVDNPSNPLAVAIEAVASGRMGPLRKTADAAKDGE